MSEDTPPTTPKTCSRLFILLLLIAVILCSGVCYSWWLLKQKKDADQSTSVNVEHPATPVFILLDTFTGNLLTVDNNPDRMLYIGRMPLLLEDTTNYKLSNFLPEVRSRLLLLLSRQESSQLFSKTGGKQLITQIKKVLSRTCVEGQPVLMISNVLFTTRILR